MAPGSDRPIDIDGAFGEGGGQLLRTAVALAAITGRPLRVFDVRAGRAKPGLAAQHVAAVRAVAALCNANTSGVAVGSREIRFAPGVLRAGTHRFEVGTAGSVTLVLQALLPVMLATGQACSVTVTGGTDLPRSPPADYLAEVLLPLVRRLGARAEFAIIRRGYYPRGGGEVTLATAASRLEPLRFDQSPAPGVIRGRSHVSNLPAHIAQRMHAAAAAFLERAGFDAVDIAVEVYGRDRAFGAGAAIVLWHGKPPSGPIGAAQVAERGVRAEALGEAAAAELAADLRSRAGIDRHAADQLPVYLALARGGGFTASGLSSHARTATWLIERFLPVRFDTSEDAGLTRVTVRAAGAATPPDHPRSSAS